MKYNEHFTKEGVGKRKNKEKLKLLEMLTRYKSLSD
jgi:hypothetical protein